MARRTHHLPWRAAGAAAEAQSVDGVLRRSGWAFTNGSADDLEQFVASGDRELTDVLDALHLDLPTTTTAIEIGSGIGRMTPAFTNRFRRVIACDLDAAFLERCREVVTRFGEPEHLHTVHVADGRTLVIPDRTATLTYSSFTLPHCAHDEALALTREAVRVTAPGGHVVLQFRTWSAPDVMLRPGGRLARMAFGLPAVGRRLASNQLAARLGWQANRLTPSRVLAEVGPAFDTVRLMRGPQRIPFDEPGATDAVLPDADRRHWWLVGRVHTDG